MGISRHIAMQDLTPVVADDEKAVQHTKRERWDGEKVHRRNGLAMVSEERQPLLDGICTSRGSPHPSRDTPFREIETQLEQFAVNARRSQVGFSATIRKIRARTSLLTRFRPPTRLNLEIHAQYKPNPAGCQFTTVRGVTKTRGFLHPDQSVLNATQNSLCRAVNRVRGRCACKASSCRRRAKFSRMRSSRERKELTIHPKRCRSDTIMARILSQLSEFSFFAKSFISQMYNVLARHRNGHDVKRAIRGGQIRVGCRSDTEGYLRNVL